MKNTFFGITTNSLKFCENWDGYIYPITIRYTSNEVKRDYGMYRYNIPWYQVEGNLLSVDNKSECDYSYIYLDNKARVIRTKGNCFYYYED